MLFKKKPIYIVGIVVFTLILLADLGLYFLIPSRGGKMPGMGGGFNGEMPEGFDPESFDPEGFGGQMGPDFGSGEMPEGFGGQMPGNGEDFTMPEGFDGSDMPDRGQMNSMGGGGFFSTVRSAFWPILIVCILGDTLCIFMLIRISGRKSNKQEDDDDDSNGDDPPRRDRTNTILAVIAVLLAGSVALTSLPNGATSGGMEAQISVQQAQATANDLVSVFSGSGTLQSSDAVQLEIPSTVKVTSYTVKNGDGVQEGDVVANVDKTSALKAIYEVQSLITEMDAEIAEVRSNTLDESITARADGRVKAIYIAEGDSVASAMYENGAVMLISLGGSMTVEVESQEEVTVGQTLTVTLSDESQIVGKVQQVQDGKITVTTTDNGPAPDDSVSVATQEGTVLGTGTLRISSPLKVTGYFGTADRIKVDVDALVETGDTLITLEDTEDLARYTKLLLEREELVALLKDLHQMYQDGQIKAAQNGVISQLDSDIPHSPISSGMSASSSGEMMPPEDEVTPPDGADVPPSGSEPLPDSNTGSPEQALADGVYAGKVSRVSYGTIEFRISGQDVTGASIADVAAMPESLFISAMQFSLSSGIPVYVYQDGQLIPSTVNAIQEEDFVLLYLSDGTVARIDCMTGSGTPGGMPGGNMPGGGMQMPSMGGGFGFGSLTDEEEEEEAVYEVEKITAYAITPAEVMTIAVSVDELDILALTAGQEAIITLDALPGQSFTGTVYKINPTGTNEGGSTKYTVTMEVPRSSQMLPGMNASVLIEVSRLDSVLTVPAAAVQEDGNRTYIYTALDGKTGEPANPVDVTTGSSDGTSIEILSGLTSGDTIYYSYADSIVYRFAN